LRQIQLDGLCEYSEPARGFGSTFYLHSNSELLGLVDPTTREMKSTRFSWGYLVSFCFVLFYFVAVAVAKRAGEKAPRSDNIQQADDHILDATDTK